MAEHARVVVRADGGADIGAGHLVRTSALAEALGSIGCEVCFAGTASSRAMMASLGGSVEGWIELAAPADANEFAAKAEAGDVVIIDHYGLGRDYELACRAWASRLVALDDAPVRSHVCDYLLDQTCGRSPVEYEDLVPPGTRVLTGTGYALLRPQFAAARLAAARRDMFPPERLFVAFGATDVRGMMVPVLESLRRADGSIAIDAVIQSSAPHLESVRAAATRLDVTLHVDATDVPDLMANADIAVLAAGSTAWEACCLGLAPLLLVCADNQLAVAEALANRAAALVCVTAEETGDALLALCADPQRYRGIRARAAALCDGLGARRLAMELFPERDRDGDPVTLRPATMADADLILEWQGAPETRRYARDPRIPTSAEHRAWMADRLARLDCLFNIILVAGRPVGVLRLDRHDDVFEVSIFVAPGHYGRGIARAALALGRRLLPDSGFIAHVLPQNEASHALFRAAGFVRQGDWYHAHPAAGRS